MKVPDRVGLWRIEDWEWRENGVELELVRLPHGAGRQQQGDPGTGLPQQDLEATPSSLVAFELPWDGSGSGARRQAFAAVSSTSAGWSGAALYADTGGILEPLGPSGRGRSIIGTLATSLPGGESCLFDGGISFEVDLLSADFGLTSTTMSALAAGANQALIGDEVVQFAQVLQLTETRWRIRGLLRGRGGSEIAAKAGHAPGSPFVLLDGAPVALDASVLGSASTIAAIGIADVELVTGTILRSGVTLRPLTPVHPFSQVRSDGSLVLGWTRRARAAWEWRDQVDVPMNEGGERYLVGIGPVDAPALHWETSEPHLEVSPTTLTTIIATYSGQTIWVRQIGSHASSEPLKLFELS